MKIWKLILLKNKIIIFFSLIFLQSLIMNCNKNEKYDYTIFYLLFIKYDIGFTCETPNIVLERNIPRELNLSKGNISWFDIQDRIDSNSFSRHSYLLKVEKQSEQNLELYILSCRERNLNPLKLDPEDGDSQILNYRISLNGSSERSRDIIGILDINQNSKIRIVYEGVYIPTHQIKNNETSTN